MNLSTSWDPGILRNTVWESLMKFKGKGNNFSGCRKTGALARALGLWAVGLRMPENGPLDPGPHPRPGLRLPRHLSHFERTTGFLRKALP